MTNEQKLQKLLQIAVDNGWKDFYIQTHIMQHAYISDFIHRINLNDLVSNWEEGETSFVEALCKAYPAIEEQYSVRSHTPFHILLISLWVKLPTSQRLEWLFETFKHLLDA